MLFRILIMLIACLLGIVRLAIASENKQSLHWGYVPFKPYYYAERGKVKGIVEKKLRKAFKQAELEFTSQQYPNKRAQRFLIEHQEIDFTVVIPSFMPTTDGFLVSKHPISKIYLDAVSLTGTENIQRISDLKGYNLILLAGYSYGGNRAILDSSKEFLISTIVEDHASGLAALEAGRGNIFLGYRRPINELEKSNRKSYFHFSLDAFEMYLYLRDDIDNADKLIKRIDEAILKTNIDD